MQKRIEAEKWMSHFKKYETSQDIKEDEFDEIRASFREDYDKLKENEKEELWDFFLARKRWGVPSNNNYYILSEMYNEDILNNYSILSNEQMEMLEKLDIEISDLQLPNFDKLFSAVPYIMLKTIIEHFRVYCWNEFSKLNISSLNNESKINILDKSMIFGELADMYQLNHIFEIIPRESFHGLSSTQLSEYISNFANDLKTPILKKIKISQEYLFCPELVGSILPLASDDDKINISENIVNTHLKLIALKNQGFVIPKILNTNILLLKKISHK